MQEDSNRWSGRHELIAIETDGPSVSSVPSETESVLKRFRDVPSFLQLGCESGPGASYHTDWMRFSSFRSPGIASMTAQLLSRLKVAWTVFAVAAFTLAGAASRPGLADEKPGSGSLAAAVQPFVDSHTLAGAVLLVADKDRTLATETAGFADIAGKKPMEPVSLFWIASMSKPITAAALMILVDEGKVKLDDPVEKYLPEFKNLWLTAEKDDSHILLKRPSHPITIRECLSHTSGLPFKSEMETPTLDGLPLKDAVRSYTITPMIFDPGTKYTYSNAGINTAGRIIEVVSGKPYETFLDERLFAPLGMKDTTFWPSEEQVARLAKSYRPDASKTNLDEFPISQLLYPLSDRAHRFPMPGGGLFGTAEDMARFCRMILGDGTFEGKKILSAESVGELTKRQTPESVKESYGLGFSTGGGSFGHGGAHATNMSIDKKAGLIFVYMVQHGGYANMDGNQIQPAFQKAARARFGK